MSRARYHHHHRYHHRRGPVGLPFVPLLVLCAAVLAAVGVAGMALVAVAAILLPFMLLAVGTVAVARHLHRRHRRAVGRRQPAPTQAAPLAKAAAAPDWRASRARFAQLRSEYGRFECDPLAVLRLPALADVTVPATGRFVEAFAEAQALDTDTEPSAAHLARYASAVEAACRAWQAAREAAERIRLAGIPEHERATVQRAIKLLTMARDSDHDAERIAAYAKARTELAKLDRSGTLRLPVAAAAAVDAAARGQLPPAPATA